MKIQIYSLTPSSSSLSKAVRLYIWHFLSRNITLLQLNMFPFFPPIFFFYRGFKLLLRNLYKDRLGFLDQLGIYFKVPAMQFMIQWRGQSEITQYKVWTVWMLHHFNVVLLTSLLHKSSYVRLSIVLMKSLPSKKFWSFPPDMIKESFHYHLVILLTYPCFRRADMLDRPSLGNQRRQPTSVSSLPFAETFRILDSPL